MTTSLPSEFVHFCVEYSTISLLYYDYCLTFTAEAHYIWNQRFRLSTLLYVLCRYALFSNVMYVLTLAEVVHGSCDLGYRISAAISVLGRSSVLIVWGVRTYVVWGRNKLVAGWLAVLGVACIVANVISVFSTRCDWEDSVPLTGLLFGIFLALFEISATVLTIVRSVQTLRISGGWKTQRTGLYALMLEQGILYLLVVCVFTIIPYVVNLLLKTPAIQRLLNAYPMPITGLMTARFLLYLRKWEERRCLSQEQEMTISTRGTLEFNTRRSLMTFTEELGQDTLKAGHL